jgi:hypothetical protein
MIDQHEREDTGHGLWASVRAADGQIHNLRVAGRKRQPGSALIGTATGLLAALAVGVFAVSLNAQYRYVYSVKHAVAPSWTEALALDVAMVIFGLLALALARAAKGALIERWCVLACGAGSAVMNFAAANDASPKSVLAYVMPPVLLSLVVDRVIGVVRRYMLGTDEGSPWAMAGRIAVAALRAFGVVLLYVLRLVLDPAAFCGIRRLVIQAAELPAKPQKPAKPAAASAVVPADAIKVLPGASGYRPRGPRGPRADSKTAQFLARVQGAYGDLAAIDLSRVGRICNELHGDLDEAAARGALGKAIKAALATRGGGNQ